MAFTNRNGFNNLRNLQNFTSTQILRFLKVRGRMLMKQHVAVDIGASSGRVVSGIFKNNKITLKEIYRFENSIVERAGSCFWDIDHLFVEIINGLKVARELGIENCTLGIDTWGVDYALIDLAGKRIGEIYSYRDDRTKTVLEDIQKGQSLAKIYEKTGIQFLNFNTLFQLYVHDQTELKKAKKILLVPDYLYYRLSGKFISEQTNASTTQLLNIQTGNYDEDLLQLVGVRRDQFALLTAPGESVGPILEALRSQEDLPQCELVCVASHDTASAVLGVPGVDEHFAYLCSGTWSLIGVENNVPIATGESYHKNYTNEWGAYGTYRFLKNIMGLWLIQEVLRNMGKPGAFTQIVSETQKVQPFQFLIDCNDRCFLKPESMIEEIQCYCRETKQLIPKTAGELGRCIFDSLALMYRKALQEISVLNGCPIQALHIVGGGVNNGLLCQLTADVAGISVIAGPVESTALGNILVQMISSGELKNITEARQRVKDSFDIKTYEPNKIANLAETYKKFSLLVEKKGCEQSARGKVLIHL